MSLRINDQAPNFQVETTQGAIDFHDWIGDSWAVLFSHPKQSNFHPDWERFSPRKIIANSRHINILPKE